MTREKLHVKVLKLEKEIGLICISGQKPTPVIFVNMILNIFGSVYKTMIIRLNLIYAIFVLKYKTLKFC